MVTDATIRPVSRQRGELTPAQKRRALRAATKAEEATAEHRAVIVAILAEGASFAEVSKFTGLSTQTLQRWKRDA